MSAGDCISPLAPTSVPALPPVGGVRLAVGETGQKYKNRPDLLLALVDDDATVAGCLTRSMTRSAPVDWCAANLAAGRARAVLVNAGNANAFTGAAGMAAVEACADAVAAAVGCNRKEVFIASTGVIGERLDPGVIVSWVDRLAAGARRDGWHDAARAIMTTDTFPKLATRTARIGDVAVTINGIAKGSGMIAPDMATMLAFIFTDAAIAAPTLQSLLEQAVATTFNCITVDSDTSTSDTVLAIATGKAGNDGAAAAPHDERLLDFATALVAVCRELAHLVVRDGEGAEKFITVNVAGAEHNAAARRIAMAIANSPLVKTAIAGADANWGRIVMAVGKAGERADRDRLCIDIGGVRVATNGAADPDYREDHIAAHMHSRHIDIAVDVGVGDGAATVWTCDLTHRYIDINADYRS